MKWLPICAAADFTVRTIKKIYLTDCLWRQKDFSFKEKSMELETLTQTIINALEDVKARDIKVFNTEELTDQFECVVIASGTSGRQTRALAYAVSHAVKGSRRQRDWHGG